MRTTPQERLALGTVALLLAAGAGARALRPEPAPAEWSGPGVEAAALAGLREKVEDEVARERTRSTPLAPGERIDPNTASADQLARLPGVGPGLAQRIVERRAARGPFRTLADLDSVPGVGPALMARAAPHLALAAAPSAPSLPRGGVTAAAALSPSGTPLDLNRATPAELEALPGVGPALAARIAGHRARRPFRSVDELEEVPGVGPRMVERLRPLVRATP